MLVSLLLSVSTVLAADGDDLVPYRKGKLWGYADRQGNVVIEPKYQHAYLFRDGRAWVYLDHKCGAINGSGDIVIPLKYTFFQAVPNTSTIIVRNDAGNYSRKYGLIDNSGKELVPFKYRKISLRNHAKPGQPEMAQYVAYYGNHERPVILDHSGRELTPVFKYGAYIGFGRNVVQTADGDALMVDANGSIEPLPDNWPYNPTMNRDYLFMNIRKGLYRISSREIIIPPGKYDIVMPFGANAKIVVVRKGELYGFVSLEDGREIIPPKYDRAGPGVGFEMREVLSYWMRSAGDGVWCIIDKDGNEIRPPKTYDRVWAFRGASFSKVGKDGKLGMVDRSGQEVFPSEYDHVAVVHLRQEVCFFRRSGGKGEVVDVSGKRKFSIQCDELRDELRHERPNFDYLVAKKGDLTGLVDKKGRLCVPFKYSSISHIPGLPPEIRIAYLDGKAALVDVTTGNEVMPPTYHYIEPFTDDLVKVRIRHGRIETFGLLDATTFREVIPVKYLGIKLKSANVFQVKYERADGTVGGGFIDDKGREYWEDVARPQPTPTEEDPR